MPKSPTAKAILVLAGLVISAIAGIVTIGGKLIPAVRAVSTQSDVKDVEGQLRDVRGELEEQVRTTRRELDAKIGEVRVEARDQYQRIDEKLEVLDARTWEILKELKRR